MPLFSNAIDRLLTFKNSQGQPARGTLLHLTRSTVAFEVYNPYSIVQLSEVLQDLTIHRGESPVYKGKAVVSSLVNTGLMLIVSATLVDRWQDLALLLAHRNDLKTEVELFVGDWEKTKRIRPGYQIAVGELRSFLSQLSPWVDQVDMDTSDSAAQVSQEIFDQLKGPLVPKVAELQQRFENEARVITEEELDAHRNFAQRDLLPLMMRAPFFHRSYTKPLGYAGDHQMVSMMVEGQREGPTTYSQIVNDFYLEIGLVKAHRNRLIILEKKLTELAVAAEATGSKVRVLNVGCGPAIELQRFIKNTPLCERCEFQLVDFNAETLDVARSRLESAIKVSGRGPRIEFVQQSVHNLLKLSASSDRHAEREFDFIYCAGLFDYLSDRICQRLLRLFCEWTRPGGMVMATNVHPDNPTRWIMEHVVEWHLIHRTMQDLAALAPPRYPWRVYDDPTHLNVFLEISV